MMLMRSSGKVNYQLYDGDAVKNFEQDVYWSFRSENLAVASITSAITDCYCGARSFFTVVTNDPVDKLDWKTRREQCALLQGEVWVDWSWFKIAKAGTSFFGYECSFPKESCALVYTIANPPPRPRPGGNSPENPVTVIVWVPTSAPASEIEFYNAISAAVLSLGQDNVRGKFSLVTESEQDVALKLPSELAPKHAQMREKEIEAIEAERKAWMEEQKVKRAQEKEKRLAQAQLRAQAPAQAQNNTEKKDGECTLL